MHMDINWHENPHLHETQNQDTHVIAHYLPNTLTYLEPMAPNHPPNKNEPNATRILCIHHQNQSIGDIQQLQNFAQLSHKINQSLPFVQVAPPIPLNIEVNENHLWNKSQDLVFTPHNDSPPPLLLYPNNLPPKFFIQYSYFTNGSFYPPVEISPSIWQVETASYGIYNAYKNLRISKRLRGLQNIFRAELIAILETIIYNNSICPHEPSHILIDSLNSIYLIKTQITHPSQYNIIILIK